MLGIWPSAARAIEAFGLIHASERRRAFDRNALLQQMFAEGFEGAPSARRMVIGLNGFAIRHSDVPSTIPFPCELRLRSEHAFRKGARFFQIAHFPGHLRPMCTDVRSCISKMVIAFSGREAEARA